MWSSHNTSSRPEDKKTQEYFSCVSLGLGFRVRYLGYQKRERQKKTDVFFERLLNDAASLFYKTAVCLFSFALSFAKRDYIHCRRRTLSLEAVEPWWCFRKKKKKKKNLFLTKGFERIIEKTL